MEVDKSCDQFISMLYIHDFVLPHAFIKCVSTFKILSLWVSLVGLYLVPFLITMGNPFIGGQLPASAA